MSGLFDTKIMAVIPDYVIDKIAETDSIKMLGTVDEHGKPNVVIISTLSVLDPETVAFADLHLGKTKVNLNNTAKLTISVVGTDKKTFQIQCKFIHFDTKSPMFDIWHDAVWEKMNMQLKGIAVAKVIRVIETKL